MTVATAQHLPTMPSLLLSMIGDETLVLVMVCLDAASLASMVCSCQHLTRLEELFRDFIWQARVLSHYGRLSLPENTSSWKELAKSLYTGHGHYLGFSLDFSTYGFEPYPMDLTLSPEFDQDGNSSSRMFWRTLRQSVTRVDMTGSVINRQVGMLESVRFVEAELLAGSNILVPNHYVGFASGPSLIGVYPAGSFFLIRTEAIPATSRLLLLPEQVGALHVDSGDPSVAQLLATGSRMHGITAMNVTRVSHINETLPPPEPLVFELVLQLEGDAYRDAGSCNVTDTVKTFKERCHVHSWHELYCGRLFVSHEQRGTIYSIQIYLATNVRNRPFDTVMISHGKLMNNNQTESTSLPFIYHNFENLQLYGWCQGHDCMIGLHKNANYGITGSFYMQFRGNTGGHGRELQRMMQAISNSTSG